MQVDTYARLLETVAELEDKKASDEAVTKLIRHLVSTGRVKLLPQIHRELKKVAARGQALSPAVEVAHEKDAAAALRAAKEVGIEAKKANVNRTLIAGWRGQGHGKLVDRSAKAALIEIYKKVTATA